MKHKDTYQKKAGRWLRSTILTLPHGFEINLKITIQDDHGAPNALGIQTVDLFAKEFEDFWSIIIDKICDANKRVSCNQVIEKISPVIAVFSPGIINASQYPLMLLVDSLDKQQSFVFCFSGKKLIFFESYSSEDNGEGA